MGLLRRETGGFIWIITQIYMLLVRKEVMLVSWSEAGFPVAMFAALYALTMV
jgi:hypothetical protein